MMEMTKALKKRVQKAGHLLSHQLILKISARHSATGAVAWGWLQDCSQRTRLIDDAV